MTLYWWMHWFWITITIFVTAGTSSPIAVYPNSTVLPSSNKTNSTHLGKVVGNFTDLPTIQNPSTLMKIIIPENVSMYAKTSSPSLPTGVAVLKSTKAVIKKNDFLFQNITVQNNTTNDKKTVINPMTNETFITEPINVTESQLLINSSFSGVPHTDNLTYMQEEMHPEQNMENTRVRDVEDRAGSITVMGSQLSAAGITGITLGCIVVVGIICGVSYFMYHNRGFNRPQVLNDHCSNPDSSGYIDDASVRDNSEEMYSLDNDSFLNSLEAMTIQNYWTDTVKHTKL